MPPDVSVRQLVKHYVVPERAGGLRASLRSVVRRRHRLVRAVDGISFEVEPRRGRRLPGPQRRRQNHRAQGYERPAAPHRRPGGRAGIHPLETAAPSTSRKSPSSWASDSSCSGTSQPPTNPAPGISRFLPAPGLSTARRSVAGDAVAAGRGPWPQNRCTPNPLRGHGPTADAAVRSEAAGLDGPACTLSRLRLALSRQVCFAEQLWVTRRHTGLARTWRRLLSLPTTATPKEILRPTRRPLGAHRSRRRI